jgi:alkylhydroperoxidase family enzyme
MAADADVVTAMAWGECLVPPATAPPELVAAVRRAHGGLAPEWAWRFAPLPWLTRTMNEMTSQPFAYLSFRDFALVGLIVSRDNSCRYCYGAQRALMRMGGYELDAIDRLERDELIDPDPSSQLTLEFARRVSRGSPRPGAAELAALERAGRSRESIAELAFAAASTVFANRASTLIALPPSRFEGAGYQLVARLMRPLIVRRRSARRKAPEASPTPNDGVGSTVVAGLGTSPAAGVLRRAIDACLDSPVLPRRTKLLMLGVIARALECVSCERDAASALIDGGMAPHDVSEALDHLRSPTLDAREAQLVSFARETVHPQPTEIQQRLRALASTLPLGVEELLEVVGVAAVGNTLGRASIVLAQC